MFIYKYGIPKGVDPIELRKKLDELSRKSDEMLADPKVQEEIRRRARLAGTIRPGDLDRPFTI